MDGNLGKASFTARKKTQPFKNAHSFWYTAQF